MSPVGSFSTIRSWEGSQHRAFEELTYQLLRREVPEGTVAIRTGNPDGGVEWYVDLPSGKQWGWQAKYIDGIESLLGGMTNSVRRVVQERPNLEKLTFVIATNLSTGTSGGARKSERQKYDDKKLTWVNDIPGANQIVFDLIQESDLVDRLALEEHWGRGAFWWEATRFSPDWFRQHHEKQKEVAGPRYSPALNVELPIMRDLDGLRATDLVDARFARAAEEFLRSRNSIHNLDANLSTELRSELHQLSASIDTSSVLIEAVTPLRNHIEQVSGLRNNLSDMLRSVSISCQSIREVLASLASTQREGDVRQDTRVFDALYYSLLRTESQTKDLLDWFESSFYLAFEERAYLLQGPAGIGKTHLLMDAVSKALEDGDFGLVLFGNHFADSLWDSICQQLGMPNLGREVLLGMLEAAAETRNGRLLIAIDAINDTPQSDYWNTRLQEIRSYIADHPSIALAVSCRDTYLEWIDPERHRCSYVVREHPGFQGVEVEATHIYFEHFSLESPRIPLLTPDFSNPMFLRLVCEAMKSDATGEMLHGHQGRIKIFSKYLESKLTRVQRRLFQAPQSPAFVRHSASEIRKALNAITDVIAQRDFRGVSIVHLIRAIVGSTGLTDNQASVLLNELIHEGVLTEAWAPNNGEREPVVQFTFQAFSDFMVLEARLRLYADPITDPQFITWLKTQALPGVLEVASIFLPEKYGVEPIDVLNLNDMILEENFNDYRPRFVIESFFRGLPYRQSTAITEDTIRCLDIVVSHGIEVTDFYRTIFMMAPIPAHLLNANGLHKHLSKLTMPERDSGFGFATYGQLDDIYSPVSRLARWASEGPYPHYPDQVIELSATALAWLLSSADRPMRDWVTKALVQLLRGHLNIARALLSRFWYVNDPYVRQRVLLVVYGSLLRCDLPANRPEISNLLQDFSRRLHESPMPEDELAIDACRSIINWGIHQGFLPADTNDLLTRPYGFPTLGSPLSSESLKLRYKVQADAPADQSYATVYYSIMGHGDFGRYVVDSELNKFTRIRRDKSRQASANTSRSMRRSDMKFHSSLSKRWLFQRVVSLGWKPELFGDQDYWYARSDMGRSEHKSERWGKKYQWIAFHQMMARLYDNYLTVPDFGEGNPVWSPDILKLELRDIDPTLPPIAHSSFIDREESATSFETSFADLPAQLCLTFDFSALNGDIENFISLKENEPNAALTSLHRDESLRCWIALDAYESQVEKISLEKRSRLTQYIWHGSWFVPVTDSAESARKLLSLKRHNSLSWALHDETNERGIYWRELGRLADHQPDQPIGWQIVELEIDSTVSVAPTSSDYLWEGNVLDCSIDKSVVVNVPSSFIFGHGGILQQDDAAGWSDETGQVVLQSSIVSHSQPGAGVFWAEKSWLQEFLKITSTALVLITQAERLSHQLVSTGDDVRQVTLSAAVLHPDGELQSVGNILRSPWPWSAESWVEDQ